MKKRQIDGQIIKSMRLRPANIDEMRAENVCRAVDRMAQEYLRGLLTYSYELRGNASLVTVNLNRLAYFLQTLVKLANGSFIPDLKLISEKDSFKMIITNCEEISDESFYKLYGYAYEAGFEISVMENGSFLAEMRARSIEVISLYNKYGNVSIERIFNSLANILLEFNFYNGLNADRKYTEY